MFVAGVMTTVLANIAVNAGRYPDHHNLRMTTLGYWAYHKIFNNQLPKLKQFYKVRIKGSKLL